MWGLFGTIEDLLDRDEWGWTTLGDRERLDYERLQKIKSSPARSLSLETTSLRA